MLGEQENVTNLDMDGDQMQTGPVLSADMALDDSLDCNADGVFSTTSGTAASSVESYLTSSLKNLREENKRLAEENSRLKDCYETKVKEKLNYLNMMNMPSNSDDVTLLKVIHVKQLNVIDKLRNLIDMENQLDQAYDEHWKTAIKHSEKQYQVEKQEHGYDQFTTMSHVELMEMDRSIRQNIVLNETEAMRLTSQLKSEEEQHKIELNSIKKDMNTLEDVLRDASQLVQDLQFKVTQRRRGGGRN